MSKTRRLPVLLVMSASLAMSWVSACGDPATMDSVFDADTASDNNTNESQLEEPGDSPPESAQRGATVPWRTYEAESGVTNGSVVSTNQYGREASGGRSVLLNATGEYVRFTSTAAANRLVLRYSIPMDTRGTISLYVNGAHRANIPVTSAKLYETKRNEDVTLVRFYDEVDIVTSISAGDVVMLQKDSSDTISAYHIDLIDLEMASAAMAMPSGFISVTNCGATPNDTTDDTVAIRTCIARARSQNRHLWFPAGTFYVSERFDIPAGMYVRGAGKWYTKLYGFRYPADNDASSRVGFSIGSNVVISDMKISSVINTRMRTRMAISLQDFASSYVIENLWIEYTNTGIWLRRGRNGIVRNNRVRLTYADGIHADMDERNTLIEYNHVRGTGDDGIAVVSGDPTMGGPARNITARRNTVVANYWGRGMAVVGGTNIVYENNIIRDSAYRAGMMIAIEESFATHNVDGVRFVGNLVVRSGGASHGAIFTNIAREGSRADGIEILSNEIRYARRFGIWLRGGRWQETEVAYNTIVSPGSSAIVNDAVGDIDIHDNIVR
jgi:hypothetical protein